MTTPVINKKWKEDDVVCAAIGERTFQASADWFNERLPAQFQITRQSVYNWSVGINEPNHQFLNALVIFYAEGDERREMAESLLEMRRAVMADAALTEKDGKKLLKAVRVRS